jgi:REP element-mobilizing transposase RayT
MPNHVHSVFLPKADLSLGVIVGRLKGASSREANRVLGRLGALWQEDYFDRLMRNEEHLYKTVSYVEWSPVKAKLCSDPKHWPFSSRNPQQQDRLAACRKNQDDR